jgi:hypothetical protein
MLPGPTVIRRCSACTKLIEQFTLTSGNTIGARFWTDGKRDAPMLPDKRWLVKCQHCGALVWIDEQEKVGIVELEAPYRKQQQNSFKDALPYDTPSPDDYFAFLQKGVSDSEKEQYVRLCAWWAGNDARRNGEVVTPLSDDEIANLGAYAALLDETDESDRIIKAEIMRELGRYEDAVALLSTPFREQLAFAAAIIRNLSVQKIAVVREIFFE